LFTLSVSPDRFVRGPSAATYNLGGLAARIASNTFSVVSGRLKTRKSTGVCNSDGISPSGFIG